jgi:hypothetical protein
VYFTSLTRFQILTLVRERQAIRLEDLFVVAVGTELHHDGAGGDAGDLGFVELQESEQCYALLMAGIQKGII